MLIVFHNTAKEQEMDDVVSFIEALGLKAQKLPGAQRTVIGVTGNKARIQQDQLINFPGVKELIHVSKPYKLVSREFHHEDTLVEVAPGVVFGGSEPVIIAGPCGVESREQLFAIAEFLKSRGVHMLRGGAFKPRTSPYSFQGLGAEALQILAEQRRVIGLPVVTEVVSVDDLPLVAEVADMIQIGARNMHNFDLLVKAAKTGKPILLKRGMSAMLEEFLLAAEYILDAGNPNLVLCERGIRTFEKSTRNILDLNSVALIRRESHLPIIVDPSHAAGRFDLVTPLAKAGLAAGAQGLIVEVHNDPKMALSDGEQSLNFESFDELLAQI